MREQFIDWKPRTKARELIEHAERICADWQRQGYDLTLRQLYYQFVAAALIPNSFESYKSLSSRPARLALHRRSHPQRLPDTGQRHDTRRRNPDDRSGVLAAALE